MIGVGLRRGALPASVFAVLLAATGLARAESALRLPFPERFGPIPAATYDADHHRIGDASVAIESVDARHVRLRVESGIDGGAHTTATADLVTLDEGSTLQLLRQESRSVDADGVPLGVLSIDHEHGVASCTGAGGGESATQRLTLPERDRVANVPLNLLFLPLVEGTAEEVTFQLLLCRFGARLIDIDAHVVSRDDGESASSPIVEVEYQPDFGRALSLMAKRWIPRLSIWFDRRVANSWVAHRVPLYAKGPEVFVVREGFSDVWLGDAH